jgi:hypothetical protein
LQSEKNASWGNVLEKEISFCELLYILVSLFSDNDINIVDITTIKRKKVLFKEM